MSENELPSLCECGYRRTWGATCACGSSNCSKTGPDGAVCTNPYHSSDLPLKGEKWWDDEDDWYWK